MAEFKPTLLAFTADARDYIFAPTLTSIPTSVDLRGYAAYVENQSSLNSCTANAVVSACELILNANDQFINLSRLFNYYESRVHGGWFPSDVGATTRDAIAAAQKVGLPTEATWPYTASALNTTPSTEAYTEALDNLIDRYERIYDGYDIDYDTQTYTGTSTIGNARYIKDIKVAICEGYPVVIGLPLSSQFEDIVGNFDYQTAHPYIGVTPQNPMIGAHAVVIVGYNDNYDGFIIENSWGSVWGYGGYGILPYNTCAQLYEAWVIKGFKGLKVLDAINSNFPVADPTDYVPRNLIPTVEPATDPVYFFEGVFQMAILTTDLAWRKSTLVSNVAAQNGGVMNPTGGITSNVKNNLFPDVSQVERTSGSVLYRKVFLHINKNSQDELLNAYLSLGSVTPAQDFVVFYEATQTDTEATGTFTRPYGAGTLTSAVLTGDTSLEITPENFDWFVANTPIRVDDTILISDGTNSEYQVISGLTVGTTTITVTVPAINFDYAGNSLVASVYIVPSVKANYTAPAVTSATGTITSTGNLIVNDKGAVDEVWTCTFTNSTSYTVSGNTLGVVGVGTTTSDTTITNSAFMVPYFVLKSTMFGGEWAIDDTFIFATSSATVPVWIERVVPAGTADISNNFCSLTLSAESY